MKWLLLTAVLANPVPEPRVNPFMTEDDAIALMYRWKIGVRSSIRIKGVNPRPCVRVTVRDPLSYSYYHIGVDFGNPHSSKLPDGFWYRIESDGFEHMGIGRTLGDALRNAAYSGHLPQAERDEVLRRK